MTMRLRFFIVGPLFLKTPLEILLPNTLRLPPQPLHKPLPFLHNNFPMEPKNKSANPLKSPSLSYMNRLDGNQGLRFRAGLFLLQI